jgi:CheY-like chemotaxis protein
LLVEDEPLVALDIEHSLRTAGYELTGRAADIQKALALVESGTYDAAILDLNLSGRRSDDVATALTNKRIPFAFVTGYADEALPQCVSDRIVLKKPFTTDQLLSVVDSLLE